MKQERTVVICRGGFFGGVGGGQGRHSGEITRLPGLSLLLALPLAPRGHSWESNSEPPWGGGVLPTGMCRWIGYAFCPFCPKQGIQF